MFLHKITCIPILRVKVENQIKTNSAISHLAILFACDRIITDLTFAADYGEFIEVNNDLKEWKELKK